MLTPTAAQKIATEIEYAPLGLVRDVATFEPKPGKSFVQTTVYMTEIEYNLVAFFQMLAMRYRAKLYISTNKERYFTFVLE